MTTAVAGTRERRAMKQVADTLKGGGRHRNVYESRVRPTFGMFLSDSYSEACPNNLYVCLADQDTLADREGLVVVMFGRERALRRSAVGAMLVEATRGYLHSTSSARTGLIPLALSWLAQEDLTALLSPESATARGIVDAVCSEPSARRVEQIVVRVLAASKPAGAYGTVESLADLESMLSCVPTERLGGWEIEELYRASLGAGAFRSPARNAGAIYARQQLPLGSSFEVLRHLPFVEEMFARFCDPAEYQQVKDRTQWAAEYAISCEIYGRLRAGCSEQLLD